MRSGKGLVKVEVDHIIAHFAGACDTHHRIHVGSVIIDKSARVMHYFGYRLYIPLKFAHGVRVGEHKRRRVIADSVFECLNIHGSVRK